LKIKLLSIVGARPQFIKLAPIAAEIQANHPNITHCIVHTGQHYDYALSQQFFDELQIPPPNHNLEVGSGRHLVQMANILLKLDSVLMMEKPDMILVFGDTNSTAAAAIAAAKHHILLAHVEAGLREFNKSIPEEINKLLTDSVTDLYFPPTQTGVLNLKKAGIVQNVHCTGDLHLDLIKNNWDKIQKKTAFVLNKYQLQAKNYYFATIHRADNTNNVENLKQILLSFSDLDAPVLFPVHPRTHRVLLENGFDTLLNPKKVRMIEPIGYWETQVLIGQAKMVLTDSGGVSKEAYFHQTPCVILQPQIEWIEIVEEGWAVLTLPTRSQILQAVTSFQVPQHYRAQLGNGQAAKQIVDKIIFFLNQTGIRIK
jgi:UDP-N-acetylglucosamine 2-epimerase (non-hydrolysing)